MPRTDLRTVLSDLRPVDALVIFFLCLLSLIIAVADESAREWGFLATINAISAAGIVVMARASRLSKSRIWKALLDWYPAIVLFMVFKEVHVIIQAFGRPDWDSVFIAADRWVFGIDPTVWMAQFSMPVVTEVLQVAYASYYFIMLAAVIELYARREERRFAFLMFMILYGFFLSYIGYIIFPAVGPRFTLHSFGDLERELAGWVLTDPIRVFLNAAESIPTGAANAMDLAQRDAFPSGHTQMTLLTVLLAYRYRLRSRHVLLTAGTLLILSTVYLRYHYVVDLAGGVLFFLLTVGTGAGIFTWWERYSGKHINTVPETL